MADFRDMLTTLGMARVQTCTRPCMTIRLPMPHPKSCMFHLHTPAGIGRSKLGEKPPQFLPGPMTARNLRTVGALMAITQP
jgi:uncharacterized protein (DUF1697 family)